MKQKIWIGAVIVLTVFFVVFSLTFKKETKKETPTAPSKLVKVFQVRQTEVDRQMVGYGTVQPDREVTLKPEVSGQVVRLSRELGAGGIVKKGEFLLCLDPRDYEFQLEQMLAAVEKAQLELEVEEGNQVVAKREWQELSPSMQTSPLSDRLALRKPHLREKKAALDGALSRMKKAKVDLERTKIVSPMDAIVISGFVEKGDVVDPQTTLAKLVAVDQFRVQVTLPIHSLPWVSEGVQIEVIQDFNGEEKQVLPGTFFRLLGDLEEGGRMARILVLVEDPLGLKRPLSIPLLLGSYVQVRLTGQPLKNVFELPARAIREGNQIWVKNEKSELEIRKVSVLQRSKDRVVVRGDLQEGDQIVISSLPLALPGTLLEVL